MDILRITRHEATQEQVKQLERIFGEGVEIVGVSETLSTNPREAVTRFDSLAESFDIVEAVLPVQLMSAVLKFSGFARRGGRLIRAHMNRELQDDGSTTYTFSHYEEVLKVEVVTKEL